MLHYLLLLLGQAVLLLPSLTVVPPVVCLCVVLQ
jgi:hypothetical protein